MWGNAKIWQTMARDDERYEVDGEDMESMVKEDEKWRKVSQNMALKGKFDKSENEC